MHSFEYAMLLQRQHTETKWGSDFPFRHYVELFELLQSVGANTILDYGSGRQSLANHVERLNLPYEVFNYDPGTRNFSTQEADVVVCCDVLEHVEPDLLYATLAEIFKFARKAVYLVIALRQSKAKMVDGSPQHLIVEPWDFWRNELLYHTYAVQVLHKVDGKEVRLVCIK